ncbi:hypothetical protein ElyMa_000630700 [Elysia marginata]|uniref:MARVEL domain-containing protein n=1 Tax=Elysia marginata TaxID=1093978 RepID=A0AAV4GC48_9GAST|nr:hypothetical protein ElyMa_000630700 [Elysia marginata]
MSKSRVLSLGILALLITIGGVVMCVLIHFMVDVLKKGYREDALGTDNENWKQFKENSYSPVWAFGFAYIIPGVALFVAALVQNKAGYVTSAIIGLLALLLMGIFVLMAGLFLIVFIISIGAIEEHCEDTAYGCKCEVEDDSRYGSSSDSDSLTPFSECHYFSTFASLIVALFVCIIVSWFLLLAAFIMAIYFSCRSPTNQPGTVYAPVQQPVYHASGKDQPQYPPPSYNYQPQNQPMYLEGGSQPYYDGPPSKV